MSRPLELRTEHLPVAYLRIGERYDIHDLEELKRGLEALFARRKKYAMIVDTDENSHMADAKMRQTIAEWWRTFQGDQRIWCLGTAIIVPSGPRRGAMTALSWLFPSPTPQIFAADKNEAKAWIKERLREADLPFPAGAERL